jgi:predicted RNase H-like nuclease (RuvC/YqgF family)
MPDMSGHDATRRDHLHTVSVRQLEVAIGHAGIIMSRRQLIRHCKAGTFDAVKLPATNNVEEWFVAPASLEKGIADIKVLQEHRAQRDATRRDRTDSNALVITKESDSDTLGHDVTRPDASDTQLREEEDMTRLDTSRQDTTSDVDVYEHPYVKRLEAQVDKLEKKLDDQVRRTEEIQLRGQEKLLELQRMTAVGQSQTLADFMLKAKDWMLGSGSESENREEGSPA